MELNIFKLEKLRIEAHTTGSRSDLVPPTFTAMFNPASYSQSYQITWEEDATNNSSGPELKYTYSGAEEVRFDLIFDGTDVDEYALVASVQRFLGKRKPVEDQIEDFLQVAYRYKGELHEPAYLVARWGSLKFNCRLASVDIKYTLFNRDGKPLRAELSVALLSDEEAARRARLENKESPDLTHARTVRCGDTLPLLSKEVYGSSAYYLQLAGYNQLDDFRSLEPGQQLLFPPLVQLLGSDGSAGKGS